MSKTELKIIEAIERANNSVYGNPAYWITFTDGTEARTSSDSACAYEVGNSGMREGCKVVVQFTRAGRIATLGPAA